MSLTSDRIQGKVCVVTGAAKSIGFAIAEKYAQSGAKVVLIDIDPLVEASAKSLADKGYTAKAYVLNITNRDAVLKCFEDITATYGDVYALVNNAGVVDTRPFEENDEAILDKMFKVNVYGTTYCMQGALPSMKKNKQGKADFVKTSTGFGSGGATVDDVRLMKRTVGDACLVKASTGINDRATTDKMLAAGAVRMGTSKGILIIKDEKPPEDKIAY